MKRLVLALLAAFVCTTSGIRSEAQADVTRRTLDVLMVGNSFTYFNNLGDVLAGVAASLPRGPAIRPTLLVGGGMTLQWHYATGKPALLLRERKWDFVVLQEQSALGGGSEGGEARLSPPTVFHQAVRKFVPDIRASDTRTMSRTPSRSSLSGIGSIPYSGMPGPPLGPPPASTITESFVTSNEGELIRACKSL